MLAPIGNTEGQDIFNAANGEIYDTWRKTKLKVGELIPKASLAQTQSPANVNKTKLTKMDSSRDTSPVLFRGPSCSTDCLASLSHS